MTETQSEALLEEQLNNLGEYFKEEIEGTHNDVNIMAKIDWIKECSNRTVGDLKIVDKESHGVPMSSRTIDKVLDNFENSDMIDQRDWISFSSGGFKLEFELVQEE